MYVYYVYHAAQNPSEMKKNGKISRFYIARS
jgi:hypothetical protein